MFSALFSSLTNKIVSALFLVTLIGVGYLYFNNLNKEAELAKQNTFIVSQKSTLEEQSATIDNQANAIRGLKALESSSEEARMQIQAKVEQLTQQNSVVVDKTSKQVVIIQKRYAALPKTVNNEKSQEDEISTERMNELQAVYCNSVPTGADCPPAAGAESSSASSPTP